MSNGFINNEQINDIVGSSLGRYTNFSNNQNSGLTSKFLTQLPNQIKQQLTDQNGNNLFQNKNQIKPRQPLNNNMDILKKFRYNFHYWLRNCYQSDETLQNQQEPLKNNNLNA